MHEFGTIMTVFEIIRATAPYCLWLTVAGLAIALAVTSGSRLPMWSAAAALLVAGVSAAFDSLGPAVETGLFLALAIAATVPAAHRAYCRARDAAEANAEVRPPARLIGRIARSTGEFANGVGRVWIDGTEWAAELDGGEDELALGQPVRVTKVIGGVRLQVHPLAA
jgi:membrane protein implicated in regulation of membrane protease activity